MFGAPPSNVPKAQVDMYKREEEEPIISTHETLEEVTTCETWPAVMCANIVPN